jgi:heme/copper-type cytochrome/quinol oxidase subunit 3
VLLRVGNPLWPHGYEAGLNIPLATVNTMVLITSSVTVVMAWYSLQLHDLARGRLYIGATIALALTFMVIKYFEYTAKFSHGIYPRSSTFFGVYFTMTGLHGLHVLGGVVVFAYLVGPGSRMWRTQPEKYVNRIECAGLYWHFVDLVWIFLFPTLYLL